MNRYKLAFIQPLINDGNLIPPIGTLIMASLVRQIGWGTKFFDERIEPDAINNLIQYKPNIVGISCVTASVLRGLHIAKQIKQVVPDTMIVFGGPHPTAMPEEVASWDSVDIVVTGEGERSIFELCRWYESGQDKKDLTKVPNLCYKDANNNLVTNKRIPFLSAHELDRLPAPAYDLLPLEEIFKSTKHGLFSKGKRILPIMSSRGCPNHCTYCCRVMGYKIRYRDPMSVVDEVECFVKRYNLDEIWFEDDNFTANKERCHAILDELIKRRLNIWIKFANGIRADGVDFETLKKMKTAGCYSISFGIESGSEKVLKLMKKNLSLQKARENVKLAQSLGMFVGANCIIGYPGETEEDVKESIDFFMGLNLDSMAIVNLIPFPGTEVRHICEKNGYLTKEAEDWDNYYFDIKSPKILIETPYLSGLRLKGLIDYAYRRMYLNPKRVLKIIRYMKKETIIDGLKIMTNKIIKI